MSEKNKKDMKFEDAAARLEEVVKSLEDDKMPLDKMLSLYEEGVSLVRFCLSQLDAAEQKVEILRRSDDGSGSITTVRFDTSEN